MKKPERVVTGGVALYLVVSVSMFVWVVVADSHRDREAFWKDFPSRFLSAWGCLSILWR